ncbi:MAG TPA: DUF4329 domain-containing protein [Bacteroidales bacterium]|nr:DUF4329 domain-containing protein [Bacteroidales bacterium]HCI55976.1 hypothetical protein [Bacteroidales bacterium]HOU95725.1 DUF4329 domain-containing protein [Bacteroidales bacterium]HQG52887.1 DUF4329 domain-containing protein [Bacteroidales bacterium]HQJ20206.1 DUF4329 domain-containing protein [Bacteroidales bacterium]
MTSGIKYYYDSMGAKLKRVVKSGINVTARYYLDGFEYSGDKHLSLIHMDVGVITDSAGYWRYEYFIKDHLGNTRVAVRSEANNGVLLTQSVDYYPSGMSFSTQYNNGTDNKYLYNGKELQDEQINNVSLDWYDYGAWLYDSQIGRFTTVDPMAEISRKWSPYVYVYDNSLRFIDQDGMIPGPGDPFNSLKDAVKDFGNIYGSLAILENREFRTRIYSIVDEKGNKTYSYSIPLKGEEASVNAIIPLHKGQRGEAGTHTHPTKEFFSPQDVANSIGRNEPEYIVVSTGVLKIFDPKVDKVSDGNEKIYDDNTFMPRGSAKGRELSSDMPSKEPYRRNNIDPVRDENAPYYNSWVKLVFDAAISYLKPSK